MPPLKRILVAPLDWGLGHATRCIPVIDELVRKGCEVIVAADEGPAALLQDAFPQLQHVQLPGYGIRYPKSGASMVFSMARQVPAIVAGIQREHAALQDLIDEFKLDGVVSDNRFGLWNQAVPCVFMTHQITIKSPVFESVLARLNKGYIERFNHLWIPDYPGEANLSGDLGHKRELTANTRFVGPLSRFATMQPSEAETWRYVGIVSGPEPQRSEFETLLKQCFLKQHGECLLVAGQPDQDFDKLDGSVRHVSHLDAQALLNAIAGADCIVARSGYSTVMDLAVLNKSAIFVPTPGQTEQEYLGNLLKQRDHVVISQSQLRDEGLPKQTIAGSWPHPQSDSMLKRAVEEFVGS